MNKPQFLYLTSIGWKTGKQHRIEIWFVDYCNKYYVISERLKHAHWVQNIMHNSRVSFTVDYMTFEGTARVVDQNKDSKLAAEVSNLMDTKYRWKDGLIIELIPN